MSRRRTALLAGSALLAGLGLVAPSSAHAAGNACIGTGSATLSTGISYPPSSSSSVGFTFTFNCATGGSITGSGTLDTAACGNSMGTGSISGVGGFTIATAGSMLVVSGALHGNDIAGGGNATPIPNTSTIPFGNSCSNGTAQVFTLVGGVTW